MYYKVSVTYVAVSATKQDASTPCISIQRIGFINNNNINNDSRTRTYKLQNNGNNNIILWSNGSTNIILYGNDDIYVIIYVRKSAPSCNRNIVII